MTTSTSNEAFTVVDWAWAGAALEDNQSGDLHVVAALQWGTLLAVIDGLGHGPEAAAAARAAAAILHEHATLPVQDLVELCHEGLRGTRGAVMSLASLDVRSSTIDWCGVGNVEGVLFRSSTAALSKREALSLRGGVVGYRLPQLKVSTHSVQPGDTLVLVTDGIRSEFAAAVDSEAPTQSIASSVLACCARGSDDALVLVARYLGATP